DSYSDCARGLTIGALVPFMLLGQEPLNHKPRLNRVRARRRGRERAAHAAALSMLALSPRRRFAPLCRAIGTRRPPRRWSSQDIASPESALKNGRLPALVWKIRLLHGAQTRLREEPAVPRDAPGAPSRLRAD